MRQGDHHDRPLFRPSSTKQNLPSVLDRHGALNGWRMVHDHRVVRADHGSVGIVSRTRAGRYGPMLARPATTAGWFAQRRFSRNGSRPHEPSAPQRIRLPLH